MLADCQAEYELMESVAKSKPTNDDGDIDVAGNDNADATKVPDVKIGSSGFMGGYTEKDRPPSETDEEDTGRGDSTGLFPIGERSEEQHGNESDDVWRNSEQLSLSCQPSS